MFKIISSLVSSNLSEDERRQNYQTYLGVGLQDYESPVIEFLVKGFRDSGLILSLDYVKGKFPESAEVFNYIKDQELKGDDFQQYLLGKKEEEQERLREQHLIKLSDAIKRKDVLGAEKVFGQLTNFADVKRHEYLFRTVADIDLYAYYKRIQQQEIGMLTFIDVVDDATGGLPKGTFTTVAAFIGQFKSTLLYNLLMQNITIGGRRGVLVSGEVNAERVKQILLGMFSITKESHWIKVKDIIHGNLSKEDEDYLFQTLETEFKEYAERMVVLELGDFPNQRVTGETLKNILYDIDEKMPIDFVLIDYLQMLGYQYESFDKQVYFLNKFVADLKQMALDFKGRQLTVVAAAQINRQSYMEALRKGGVYNAAAIAQLNEVERSSDIILGIFAKELEVLEAGIINMQVIKNRIGETILTPFQVGVMPAYQRIGSVMRPDIKEEDILNTILGG